MIEALKKLQEQVMGSSYQKDFERRAARWVEMLRKPEFKGLLTHFEEEIDYLHRALEVKDDINARAEIKVYRKILQLAQTYASIKS